MRTRYPSVSERYNRFMAMKERAKTNTSNNRTCLDHNGKLCPDWSLESTKETKLHLLDPFCSGLPPQAPCVQQMGGSFFLGDPSRPTKSKAHTTPSLGPPVLWGTRASAKVSGQKKPLSSEVSKGFGPDHAL